MPVYKSAEKTKDGRCWFFQVSLSSGGSNSKYKSRRFLTKKEAEQAEAVYRLNNEKGNPSRLTFDQLISEYLAEKKETLKPQSWLRSRVLCGHVSASLGGVSVTGMNKAQYEAFRASVASHPSWSVCYKNKVLKHCRALISYADKKHDVMNRIPFKYGPLVDPVAPIKKMDYFTKAEFDQFLDAVDDLRFRCFFSVLFYCGLRLGEANGLQWRSVDLEGRTLSIVQTVSTKMKTADGSYLITAPKTSGSVRAVPFSASVGALLSELYAFWSRYDEFSQDWFVFGGYKPFSETYISLVKDKTCARAGVKKIRIHDFRHSCASYYVHLGASPSVLARLLGHSSAKMTLDVYSHFYETDLRRLVDGG